MSNKIKGYLRRNLPVELVAERADISRATLWKVAKDDVMGRTMQDLELSVRKRARKEK